MGRRCFKDENNLRFWEKEITDSLSNSTLDSLLPSQVYNNVSRSFAEAVKNWQKFLDEGVENGIIGHLYREHVGEEIPKELLQKCSLVVDSNFKLFDGISQEDSVSPDNAIPSYTKIVWDWWEISENTSGKLILSSKQIPLVKQKLLSKINELKKLSEKLREDFYVAEPNVLFGGYIWEDKTKEKLYNSLLEKVEKLENELDA